jgi:sulfite exporter TauE/SafE
MFKIIVGLFLSGLLFGSGPCLASCGPILIAYIAGARKNVVKSLLVYILFSISRIFVYILLALMVFFFGRFMLEQLLGEYYKYVIIVGGAFIILIGILMALGRSLEIRPFKFLGKTILEHDIKSIVVLGLIIGLLPCAPLLAILSYVGLVSKSWPQSLLYGFSFGLGTFISPLILLAMLAGLMPGFLVDKKGLYAQIFSLICGLIIIFLGLQLIRKAF